MRSLRRISMGVLAAAALLACAACARRAVEGESARPAEPVRLRLATTTSTDNTGLLGVLLPPFEKRWNVKVDVISVGTGKALKLGETGDVDVVLVHARAAEDAFLDAGHGVNRRDVMHNDFVLVGPAEDPAGVKALGAADAALKAVAEKSLPFVSRGDDSGTHKKEKQLWAAAGVEPGGSWYLEAGQGMGPTLLLASEKAAYCLVDRATWLAFREKTALSLLLEGDERLFNPYGVIAVNPARHPEARYLEAMLFIGWVTSPEGQSIIGGFTKDGKVLFHSDAVPPRKP